MRLTPLTALAALAIASTIGVAPAASAQPSLDHDYVAVLGAGDLPETPREAEQGWTLVQIVRYAPTGNTTEVAVGIPTGLAYQYAACTNVTCPTPTERDGRLVFTFHNATGPGTLTVAHAAAAPTSTAWATPGHGAVLVYGPEGHTLDIPGAQRDGTRAWNEGDIASTYVVAVAPSATAPVTPETAFAWLELVAGLVAGAAIWAFLVSRGTVQRRTRRQVAGPAAHEGLKGRSKQELETRKRVLMAALKDLEKAKPDLDHAIYDAVKADLKKQTVTVMRALEDAEKAA